MIFDSNKIASTDLDLR